MTMTQNPTSTASPEALAQDYNYAHFHPSIMMKDVQMTMRSRGPHPGDPAPDFTLEDTEGQSWNLRELQGQPVVLILGSATCPLTRGGIPALKQVHRDYWDRTQWLTLYVREAHPGEDLPSHESYEQKVQQARFLKAAEDLSWPALVDGLEGSVHHTYGMLPNAVFLIDVEGRVAFRGNFSHGPTLRRALEQLFAQGGRGVVPEGEDRMMHMLGAITFGWEAIQRGGEIAVRDVATGLPPLAANLWMGDKLSPLLSPLARRSTPLPAPVKIGAVVAASAIAAGLWSTTRGEEP